MGSKIYTRKGDLGLTSLFSGEKVAKDDLRLQAYGALDELQAQLGMARALTKNEELGPILHRNSARYLGSLRGAGLEFRRSRSPAQAHRAQRYGTARDLYRQLYLALPAAEALHHSWQNPRQRGSASGAHDLPARGASDCRREPEVGGYDEILVYFNRLSDLLFVLGWSMEVMAVVDDAVQEVISSAFEMRPGMRLPDVVSEMLAGVAEAEAAKMEVPMAIAMVDSEGGLQLFKRMDGTLPVSTELAVSKAYTAAVLRMPTHQVGELAQPGRRALRNSAHPQRQDHAFRRRLSAVHRRHGGGGNRS